MHQQLVVINHQTACTNHPIEAFAYPLKLREKRFSISVVGKRLDMRT